MTDPQFFNQTRDPGDEDPEPQGDDIDHGGVGNDRRDVGEQPEC